MIINFMKIHLDFKLIIEVFKMHNILEKYLKILNLYLNNK